VPPCSSQVTSNVVLRWFKPVGEEELRIAL